MKHLVFFLFVLFFSCFREAQDASYTDFVKSFKEEVSKNSVNFGEIAFRNSLPMTKQEALQFVYDGDSSKLYCKQEIFNMETEKTSGISTELYLPSKCLKISSNDYMLIGYSEYRCQDPNELLKIILRLSIVSNAYQVTDNLIAYQGSDYDFDTMGLISPTTGNILLVNVNQKNGKTDAFVYQVNTKTLKFEILKESLGVVGSTDNLLKLSERLGWESLF
ncbi:MAG: hypothetical protein RIE86_01035 [Imperialibacter sp.]|uniref:hypothetical protein n=1 Tax=Imperialibacter sp. TaxID=2038411 RepID=UPI0032EE8BCB